MTWNTKDIPDLSEKVAVVTGANSGLGLETARALAGARAHVVMAARNQEKAVVAHDDILSGHPSASLEIVELDLGSLDSVETAASKIASDHPEVDILVNNAGVMAMPERATEDGFESQFGINHLGHWALTAHLIPNLLAADAARVVTVTSFARQSGRPVDPTNPHLRGNYDPWRAYGQSKLANYHFAIGLNREFERHGASASSIAAHPGLTNSDLQVRTVEESDGRIGEFWKDAAARFGMTPSEGALPQVRAAVDPTVRGGQLYAPRFVSFGPPVRRPILRRFGLTQAIEDLWKVSEQETGISLAVEEARQKA